MGTTLDAVVRAVRSAPGLGAKSALGMVTDVLGTTDWVSGPGDDAAVLDGGVSDGVAPDDGVERRVVACGEALLPDFVAHDPYGAGVAAVLTNVNDLAATGATPLGIVDTVVGDEELARQALAGMRHASALYDVPVVGGHLTISPGPPAISAFGVGHVRSPLSVTRVRPGQSLVACVALGGEMRRDFPFYRAFDQRGKRCAGDVRLLAEVADSGACVAAKDVSMAGLVGSLAMLLEWGPYGATLDLDALPAPADVPLESWLCCFPSFGFLLCAAPGREADCVTPFLRRGLHAAVVGRVDDSGRVTLAWQGESREALDVTAEPATGLARDLVR